MSRVLRDYQHEGLAAIDEAIGDGMTRPAVMMATGLGKTDLIAARLVAAARAGKRAWAVAHRDELLNQITERVRMHDDTIPIGRVQGRMNGTWRRPIVVASVQTLYRESRQARMLPPDELVVDECHHAPSPSYMSCLRWAGSFDHTPTVGFTATMIRGDRKGLGDVWQDVVFARDTRWGIDRGYLVEPRGRVVVTDHMDLEHAKVSKGDYQDGELGEMVAQDVDQIVTAWRKHASDRITVAFCPTVASSATLADEFRAAGVPAGEVYGTTPTDERARIYDDLAAGRIRVLCSVMVTTEGWDCPPVSCILMARPTRLPGLYTQIVGRGLRVSPGKVDCLVLDVVGASRTQKLVSLIDLHPSAEINRDELDALPCEECGLPIWRVGDPIDPESYCTCEPEGADTGDGRDPDGGRRRLIGPAAYEDVDMFAQSGLNWLFTRQGVRFIPAGKELVVLWPDNQDPADLITTYSIGHVSSTGWPARGGWLDDGVPHTLGEAREIGECYALDADPTIASRDAGWRAAKRRPSDAHQGFARNLGIDNPEHYTAGRLSDEISIVLATRRLADSL